VKAALASLVFVLALSRPAAAAGPSPGPITFVACAPGFPGSTSEAQPRMDAFARAVAEAVKAAGDSIRAEYYETEDAGIERLAKADAAFLMAPLPLFLKYEDRLRLASRAQAVMQGRSESEAWSLVAGKGRVKSPDALATFDLVSTAAYAPRFVRGSALGEWGRVPPKTRISPSLSVLTSLRRAASGEDVALLLDASESKALPTLPFAKDLEVVTRSAPLPAMLVATVGGRLPEPRAKEIVRALLALKDDPSGVAALAGLQLVRFAPLDDAGLRRAREGYRAVPETP
jgi:hypothetical protein